MQAGLIFPPPACPALLRKASLQVTRAGPVGKVHPAGRRRGDGSGKDREKGVSQQLGLKDTLD